MFENDPGCYLINVNIRYWRLLFIHCDPAPHSTPIPPLFPSIDIENILNYNIIYKRAEFNV